MSIQTSSVEKVSDVIQVIKSGIDFYRDASKEIDNQYIKTTFNKMIANKQAALDSLQPLALAEQGEIEEGSSVAVETRKLYTKFISMLSSDEELTYVKQLEEVEDKVLEMLDEALEEDQPRLAASTLARVRDDAQAMHDEMKRLQEYLKES